jgi:acylphosphatase
MKFNSDRSAFFAVIRGRVQGVGFRYSACDEASRLGITGWVRNAVDGSVEVLAEGRKADLSAFESWLRKGPSSAEIEEVAVKPCVAVKSFRRFSIEY